MNDLSRATSVDPVCGMTVEVREARKADRRIEHGGRTYVFCSDGCRQEFEESPESYTIRRP